jgi:hypothetical protein
MMDHDDDPSTKTCFEICHAMMDHDVETSVMTDSCSMMTGLQSSGATAFRVLIDRDEFSVMIDC